MDNKVPSVQKCVSGSAKQCWWSRLLLRSAPGSISGRAATDASSSIAGSVRADEDHDFDQDEERDTIASLADRRRRDDLEAGEDDTRIENDEDEGSPDHGNSGGDEDDDEGLLDDDDVEYTLKDRQDAINIEHPFGLPIWKPALYKKSRSVTRNAEIALHSIPSAAAERHLLPGNILWTILFGSWLSLICYTSSIIINIILSVGLGMLEWYGSWEDTSSGHLENMSKSRSVLAAVIVPLPTPTRTTLPPNRNGSKTRSRSCS